MNNHRAVIDRRIGRAIKNILDGKDDLIDPHLAKEGKVLDDLAAFRSIVMYELNDIKEVVTALLDAIAERIPGEGTVVVNEHWIEKVLAASGIDANGDELDAVHAAVG